MIVAEFSDSSLPSLDHHIEEHFVRQSTTLDYCD